MKIIFFTILLTAFSLSCSSQSNPEYQYAILSLYGPNWTVNYEDSTKNIGFGGAGLNKDDYNERIFKALHYLNQQGYELVSVGGREYYFKRPKRK